MKRYRQFEPIRISDFKAANWHHPRHRHNHYELIFIKEGTGQHFINQRVIPYSDGDVFLLGPEDEHHFDVKVTTHFIYIKFINPHSYSKDYGPSGTLQHLEYLLKSRETHLSGFQLKEADRKIVAHIFEVVVTLKADQLYNENLIWLQVFSLATVLQRNMPELKVSERWNKNIQSLFCYLHKHIYDPAKLRSQVIAEHFNTTADYIGPYFKRNTGLTLRQYIREYRLTLIKSRIVSGDYSLKEIANEFGLTDVSHLSKILRSENLPC